MDETVKTDSGAAKQNKSGGKKWLIILILLLLLLGIGVFFFRDKLPFLNSANEVEQEESFVLDVIDGKTIEVLYKDKEEIISIIGIDVPFLENADGNDECYGEEVLNKANELLVGESIIVETEGEIDDEGRLLASIRLLNKEDYGEKLLWGGYAWHDNKVVHDRFDAYENAEKFARENELGLWDEDTCGGERIAIETVEQEISMMPDEMEVVEELVEPEIEEVPAYDCSGDVYDCDSFSGTGTVQEAFEFCLDQEGGDVHLLDENDNGIVCDEDEVTTDPEADAAIENMVKLPSSGAQMVYDCSYDRYSCEDFSNSTDAQVVFEICKARGVGDIHKLDSGKNGLACEYLGE